MDLKSFTQAIEQIADEKGIAKERIVETIELAIAAAYKRDYGKRGQIIRATLDPVTGKVAVKQIKIAVDETMIKSEEEIEREEKERGRIEGTETAAGQIPVNQSAPQTAGAETDIIEDTETEKKVRFNPEKHLIMEEARSIKPDVKAGDELAFDLPYHEAYGRIAAQTAKQVIIQRVREAEREAVFEEYKTREGEVVSGIIQRIEGRNAYIDLGRTVAVLPAEEQIPGERYYPGTRMKFLLHAVERNPRGPGMFLSRSHPRFLRKLFEIEVPEISSGAVEIKTVAREAGARSKVAVTSHEKGVDPVGSLVGQKGVRVSTVIQELGGEKIDVIEWSDEQAAFISNALSPARAIEVKLDEHRRDAYVTVPEDQLSLAIGKAGQNVRLAAKLTGWRIDVRAPAHEKETVTEPPAEAEKTEAEGALPEAQEDDTQKGENQTVQEEKKSSD